MDLKNKFCQHSGCPRVACLALVCGRCFGHYCSEHLTLHQVLGQCHVVFAADFKPVSAWRGKLDCTVRPARSHWLVLLIEPLTSIFRAAATSSVYTVFVPTNTSFTSWLSLRKTW